MRHLKMIKTLRIDYLLQLIVFLINSKMVFSSGIFFILLSKLINAAVAGKVPPISPEAINLNPATAYHKI